MGSVHYTGLLIGISFVVLIQFASGNGNVTLNGQCTDTSNCTTPNAACVKKTCQCAATYFSPSSNKTTCSKRKGNVTLNGQCTDTSNCTTPNAACVKKTCQCAATYFSPSSSNTTCSQKISVNGTCNAKDSNQCADQHAKCSDNHGYRCLCSNTYYQKSSNCVPRSGVSKMFIEISTIILAMLALRCNKWFVE